MFRKFAFASLLGSVLFLDATFAADPLFRFTTINYPGAITTAPQSISPAGDIVGRYRDSANVAHGFLWPHNGPPVSIDVPDSFAGGHVVYTDARGINPAGEIVGYYMLQGEESVAGHGFLRRRDGTFVPVAPPANHLNVYLQRILPDGSILGCFHDHDTGPSMFGAVFSRGAWTAFPLGMSMTNGATPDLGLQTGFAYDMTVNRTRAFLLQKGNPTPVLFDYDYNKSNNVSVTTAWDMNASGAIVGIYQIGTGPRHGFLLENGVFTSIEFEGPGLVGPTHTTAIGINPRGDIVGSYTDPATNGLAFGFVATRAASGN